MIFQPTLEQLAHLPDSAGIYKMYGKNAELLYIGKAKNLYKRVRQYFEGHTHGAHIDTMLPMVQSIEIVQTNSETDALVLEQRLIQSLRPKYNIVFRDGKSYAYIELTNDPIPILKIHRGPKHNKSQFFGPFVDYKTLNSTFEFLQKTFLLRTCSNSEFSNRSRPCILFDIKKCSGPCTQKNINYSTQIEKTVAFLSGQSKQMLTQLHQQMQKASDDLEFEEAAKIRDQIHHISNARNHQTLESLDDRSFDILAFNSLSISPPIYSAFCFQIRDGWIKNTQKFSNIEHCANFSEFLTFFYTPQNLPPELIFTNQDVNQINLEWIHILNSKTTFLNPRHEKENQWLQQAIINLDKDLSKTKTQVDKRLSQQKSLEQLINLQPLNHIECFDISHFQGENAVGSCVVYKNGTMVPSEYRIFNIDPQNAGDDYASMKEVLIRRYQSLPSNEFPNLILIDGGKGQLTLAKEALNLIQIQIPLLGIAKGRQRISGDEDLIPEWNPEPIYPGKLHPASHFIQFIRDEAHRFAITKNRKKMSTTRFDSVLLKIPGIGQSKRKALLAAFKTPDNIMKASIEDLAKTPGITLTLAKTIKEYLTQYFN